jgi:hypothetical protein
LGGTGESRKKSGISLNTSSGGESRLTLEERTILAMMMLTTTWSVGRNKSDEAGKRKEREKRV